MKKIFSFLSLLLLSFMVSADPVSPEIAKKVAFNFYKQIQSVQLDDLELYTTSNSDISIQNTGRLKYYYVFNVHGNRGFVLVSGDDDVHPVWGYTIDGSYSTQDLPNNFRKWLEGYVSELRSIQRQNIEPTQAIQNEWNELINGKNGALKAGVSPLIKTTWNQSPYYNAKCPGGSVTGCVATAMAQIMKYWNYPKQGTGFHSYKENDYGTLSANFGSTTYDWSSMPNNVTSSNTAVATLMYHCGVSVNMDYSPQSSGAYVIKADRAVCSESAFTDFFGYASTVNGVKRSNYTNSAWLTLLKNELDNGRPIEYAGFGSGGGHAFVCDGYDGNYFHMNWGWGGAYNGNFLVDALNPSGVGTGGGSGGYNSGQQVVIGIAPPSGNVEHDLVLYEAIDITPGTIYYGQSFDVYSNLYNRGSQNFSGDYGAAVFNSDLTFIEFVEIKSNWNLPSGKVYTNGLTFESQGSLKMLPGEYYVGIFFRPSGGDWVQAGEYSGNKNLQKMEVINPNDIELNSDMVLSPTKAIQGKKFSVNVNILNDGSSTFKGTYSVDLYDLNGDWVESVGSINETNGLSPGYTYKSPYITFSTNAISAEPGTYLLAVTHKETGGSWELTGSSYHQNPVLVTVSSPAVPKDPYEDNNEESKPYQMTLSFTGNVAQLKTTGSTIHESADYDYYLIDLDNGYDYTITARVNDAYDATDGKVYTTDVLWSYNDGSGWSESFDDAGNGDIHIENGGKVKFLVAPYFQGETGTYLLDIKVTRTARVGIDDLNLSQVTVFPNPSKNAFRLESSFGLETVFLTDLNGRTIRSLTCDRIHELNLDLTDEPSGTYFLRISGENKELMKKITKL